ncbi:MAG TPA: hypothetical protein VHC20_05285 [Candidatus Paceibacterota bacterium]|nr:hypothetical protein [Candidatus Paceibacterota bacterium]
MTTICRLFGAFLIFSTALHVNAGAAALRTKYGELHTALRNNNFHRALYIASTEADGMVVGEVYAVLEYPFESLDTALKKPGDWCDLMILPLNIKYCRASDAGVAPYLDVRIARKYDQPVQDAYRLLLQLRPLAATSDYFESGLTAETGPLGTKNYRIEIDAVPVDSTHLFLHLRCSYHSGYMGRVAMQTYLSTTGANKVGFTVTGVDEAGQPIFIGGVRGAIERTVVRYYLAIDAHLGARGASPEGRLERRIASWFGASEHFARQLHEMDWQSYRALKRSEYLRQQTTLQ